MDRRKCKITLVISVVDEAGLKPSRKLFGCRGQSHRIGLRVRGLTLRAWPYHQTTPKPRLESDVSVCLDNFSIASDPRDTIVHEEQRSKRIDANMNWFKQTFASPFRPMLILKEMLMKAVSPITLGHKNLFMAHQPFSRSASKPRRHHIQS